MYSNAFQTNEGPGPKLELNGTPIMIWTQPPRYKPSSPLPLILMARSLTNISCHPTLPDKPRNVHRPCSSRTDWCSAIAREGSGPLRTNN